MIASIVLGVLGFICLAIFIAVRIVAPRSYKVALWMGWQGMFVYEGAMGRQPKWWPRARVRYPNPHDAEQPFFSVPMAIGNAVEYAQIFGAAVVPEWCTRDGGAAL